MTGLHYVWVRVRFVIEKCWSIADLTWNSTCAHKWPIGTYMLNCRLQLYTLRHVVDFNRVWKAGVEGFILTQYCLIAGHYYIVILRALQMSHPTCQWNPTLPWQETKEQRTFLWSNLCHIISSCCVGLILLWVYYVANITLNWIDGLDIVCVCVSACARER